MKKHLEAGVASLAYLWGISPSEVCQRLGITIDLSYLHPKPIGERARRALRAQNTKYKSKRLQERKYKKPIQKTIEMLEDEVFFNKLWKQLLHIAKSKIRNREDAKDQVANTLQRITCIEAGSQDELIKKAKVILRYIIRDYYAKKYRLNLIEIPIEDFYIMEEQEGLLECKEDEDESKNDKTNNIDEAFRRTGAELIKLLGMKHAGVVCGMREKTFRTLLGL